MKHILIYLFIIIATLSCNDEQATNVSKDIVMKKITANVSTNLYDVDFIDDKVGFIVGDSGTVLKTINAGENWEKIDVKLTNKLLCIKTISNNSIFIGGKGLILNSNNNGATWYQHDVSGLIYSIAFITNNEKIGLACGVIVSFNDDWAAISSTSDNGQYWNKWDDSICYKLGRISSIIPLDSSDFLLSTTLTVSFGYGTLGRNIYKLNSLTNEVDKVHNTSGIDIYSIYKVGNSSIIAVGTKGTILYSNDKGDTWETKTSGVAENLYAISGISKDVFYAVGDNGTVISTANKGQNWSKQSSGVDVKLNSICFPSANYGIVVGDNGTILKITFE